MVSRRSALLALLALALLGSVGCDGVVRARVKVISTDGEALRDAVIRLRTNGDHDLARFTNEDGCADFGGVTAPVSKVRVIVEKEGYRPERLKVRTMADNCIRISLASVEGTGRSESESLDFGSCPCGPEDGYDPTMSARFKVRDVDGRGLEWVKLRQSNRRRDPWAHVTDAGGCIGVTWVIPAHADSIRLELEKEGYRDARVVVPAMEDRCYSVTLENADNGTASTVVAIPDDECECQMFSGGKIWPGR